MKNLDLEDKCKDTPHAAEADIDGFIDEAEKFNDLALLTYDCASKNEEKDIIEKTFDATTDKLPEVIGFVEEQLEEKGASMKAVMTITVALEEMFVNIAHYAYPDHTGQAVIGVSFDGDVASITLRDKGIYFDPLAKEDPDVTAKAEDRQIGGLGIFMVKNSMDHCFYERRGDENFFEMRKKIR
jgi:anti-sigma regulatory factor (Ser/Thr protein kinase)